MTTSQKYKICKHFDSNHQTNTDKLFVYQLYLFPIYVTITVELPFILNNEGKKKTKKKTKKITSVGHVSPCPDSYDHALQ